MKYLFKIFIFSILLTSSTQMRAQVNGVKYAILFNPSTSLFDCFIYIAEGHAHSILERVQFNSQFSLVIPTGAIVDIASFHMPLVNNQEFKGTNPAKWTISSTLTSPAISPKYDYYGITPNLAPAGFYNELKRGDMIKIFSLKIEGENIDLNEVRLFDNESDPKSNDVGMQNGDFSNGFTMGGYHQLYKGIKKISQEEDYSSIDNEK